MRASLRGLRAALTVCVLLLGTAAEGVGDASLRINGKLAFTGGFRGGILTINPDGRGLKRLSRRGVAPAWSPDGREILFKVTEPKAARGIWVMRGDGTRQRRVAPGASPGWSPDGQQIVFTKYESGGPIYVMRTDGTHVRRVTRSGISPRWSPNGRQIVFWDDDPTTGTAQVFVVSVRGGKPRRLTSAAGENNLDPTWSPDGQNIAYQSSVKGDGDCLRTPMRPDSISVMHADGTAKRKVFTIDAKSCYFTDLTWSPDGKKFAFSASSRRGFAIEVINADGSAPTRLIDRHGGHGISWQPLRSR